MRLDEPTFSHLERMTDAGGLYEHAKGRSPRREHGYCVDDVARGLVVTTRQRRPTRRVATLRTGYLAFVLGAQAPDGRFHNRRGSDLRWNDEPSTADCWGRALWGLGSLVGAPVESLVPDDERAAARGAFGRGARLRSPAPRAAAFAALGAAALLRSHPHDETARTLLADAVVQVDAPGCDPTLARNGWAWPEPRLRYANAVVPEVLLAAGDLLDRPELLTRGLHLLGWLLSVQTRDRHLSVVPVAGLGPGEAGCGFDQQPIEVAALADACALAYTLTRQERWREGIRMAVGWFHGDNDSSTPMLDPATGGGFDGLERAGRNDNEGAESTLAAISVLQHGAELRLGPAVADLVRLPDRSGTDQLAGMA